MAAGFADGQHVWYKEKELGDWEVMLLLWALGCPFMELTETEAEEGIKHSCLEVQSVDAHEECTG